MAVRPPAHVQYVIDDSGKRTAVILPIDVYEELLDDIEDNVIADERRNGPTVSHEAVMEELRRDGVLSD